MIENPLRSPGRGLSLDAKESVIDDPEKQNGDAPFLIENPLVDIGNGTADAALPAGWSVKTSKHGTRYYAHVDGRKQKTAPS